MSDASPPSDPAPSDPEISPWALAGLGHPVRRRSRLVRVCRAVARSALGFGAALSADRRPRWSRWHILSELSAPDGASIDDSGPRDGPSGVNGHGAVGLVRAVGLFVAAQVVVLVVVGALLSRGCFASPVTWPPSWRPAGWRWACRRSPSPSCGWSGGSR